MRVTVTVKPGAKGTKVTEIGAGHLAVAVKEPAQEGKANYAVLEALARHFHVSLSQVRLAAGSRSRIKLVDIQL